MKKSIENRLKPFPVVLSFVSISFLSCDKEIVLPVNDVPEEITDYLSTHFPTNNVLQVIKDKDGLSKTFDVTLDGSFFLEFNGKKKVIDVNGLTEIPSSVIPAQLKQYVDVNYPNQVITGWEIDDKKQQIELDNGIDLEFDMDGNFIRIDS